MLVLGAIETPIAERVVVSNVDIDVDVGIGMGGGEVQVGGRVSAVVKVGALGTGQVLVASVASDSTVDGDEAVPEEEAK